MYLQSNRDMCIGHSHLPRFIKVDPVRLFGSTLNLEYTHVLYFTLFRSMSHIHICNPLIA